MPAIVVHVDVGQLCWRTTSAQDSHDMKLTCCLRSSAHIVVPKAGNAQAGCHVERMHQQLYAYLV